MLMKGTDRSLREDLFRNLLGGTEENEKSRSRQTVPRQVYQPARYGRKQAVLIQINIFQEGLQL
jgi:hypothetical protein